jgi:hypothetical protein
MSVCDKCGGMRYRLVLGLSVLLAACSGGGSNNMPAAPLVPWGSFRHDIGNSAAAGLLNQNNGNVSMICSVAGGGAATQCPGAITESSPAVDHDGNILLGTDVGVASFGPDGRLRWSFEGYETNTRTPHQSGCAMCMLGSSPTCLSVGRVSASPTVTPGNTIVFGTEGTAGAPGHLFALQQANGTVTCDWIFPNDGSGVDFSSSAATQISNLDFTLTSAFVGADDGQLRAFNSDGSVRWSFANRSEAGPITSSPAIDSSNNVYITTADGVLSAVNFTGGQVWQSPIGIAPGASLYPSPGVSTSIYAIGAGGTVFAISPSSQPNVAPKWQFTPPTGADGSPVPIIGSPAFITESFPVGAADNSETVVYVVDTQGTAFGLRDLDGQPFPVQRCTGGMFPPTPTQSCKTDSCQPPTTCNGSTGRCEMPTPSPTSSAESSSADSAPAAVPPAYRSYYTTGDPLQDTVPSPTPTQLPACTRDTCVVAMRGTCETSPATIEIPSQMVQEMVPASSPLIATSPVVSGDFFAVVGTTNGYVCARSLDPPYGVVPGYNMTPPNAAWGQGVCSITTGQTCVTDKDCPPVPPATPATPGPTPTPGHEACIPGGCIQLKVEGGLVEHGPTLSSPIIGQNGAIYVTTANGLWAIK